MLNIIKFCVFVFLSVGTKNVNSHMYLSLHSFIWCSQHFSVWVLSSTHPWTISFLFSVIAVVSDYVSSPSELSNPASTLLPGIYF